MKNIIVQKYGGSSVADTDKIMNIARRIKSNVLKREKVIVVVSAMGKTTDDLVKLVNEITDSPSKREMDMILSTGEQISIALLAMALHKLNIKAISLTGLQVGITTDSSHTKARILHIKPKVLKDYLKTNDVIIIAGFQGVDKNLNITTLGRGGSDTSAVALAASIAADKCEIYTDVDGVYTADPRIVKEAQKIDIITYDDMLELASLGAKVMHSRSIEIAKRFNVKLEVKSSFNKKPGTIIYKEIKGMEDITVTGVSFKKDEAKVSINDVPDKPGIAAKIFKALAFHNINVDMIVQSSSRVGVNSISFTIKENELKETIKILENVNKKLKSHGISYEKDIGIVSLVGIGMKSHPGVASKMFEILSKNKVNIQMISTSEIKISCVISKKNVERAVRALHKGFELDKISKKLKKRVKKNV